MSRTVSQADRIEGERRHRMPSISVVDRLYRLQPADLGGGDAPPATLVVRQVLAQGIERPQPMLHLEGQVKPLLLDAANIAAITRIAASPLQRDWVGREVTLAVVPENGQFVIRLFAPDDPALRALRRRSQAVARARLTALWLRRLLRYAFILLFLLALVSAALSVYQNWATLVELVATLIDGLLSP